LSASKDKKKKEYNFNNQQGIPVSSRKIHHFHSFLKRKENVGM
jgi:hypothetical protein